MAPIVTWDPKANDVFLEAVERLPGESRDTYLNEACGTDADLRAQVAALLEATDRAGSFLEAPAMADDATVLHERVIGEGHGTVIGPYKLLQQIGEGGMGVVFMAEQSEPIQRTVALKIIKPGMDTRQIIARFEAERQALALMDHPNIARVLDVGSTDAGLPYFVMDLVKGVPITDYCDQQHVTVRERLEMFSAVCNAVQHAHQKGIIHRDIKPTNVLVAEYDGIPVPKVIDFGVAKATASKLTEKTMFTELGQMVGTMEYMSPEQARFNQLDVDTRSDIYSVGVLLYELLTGSTPFGRKQLNEAAFDEMLRIIREEEPQKPSTRLSTTDALPSIAANRSLEPLKLNRLVKGELDWIVMKALEKDRNRRYETASSFAADIERHLHDEPVLAGPPSTVYRLRKFVRRNKGPVLATAVVLVTLLGGIVGTTLGLVRAEQARRAEANRAEGERLAKQEAQAVLDFVEMKVFAAARPEGQEGGLGRDVTLREAIEAALPFVDQSFADRPLIEARLRVTLGQSFNYVGESKLAIEQFIKARALLVKHRGRDHPDTLSSMSNLALSYYKLDRDAEALKLCEETVALRKSKLGPDHPDTLRSMSLLASIYSSLGQDAEALSLNEETLALRQAELGLDHPDTLASMTNLAFGYDNLGRHTEALKLSEEVLPLRKARSGLDHPDTLKSMMNLAFIYNSLGRHADAQKLYEETLALQRDKLGPDHPDTLISMMNLALIYDNLERHADALKLFNETLALQRAKLGPDHFDTLRTMSNLGYSYSQHGQEADALRLFEETLTRRKAKLGPAHPDTLRSISNLTNSYETLGRPAEALRLVSDAIRRQPNSANLYRDRAELLIRGGSFGEAVADIDKALALDPDHHQNWYQAAALYLFAGDVERYRGACRELLARFDKLAAERPKIAERTAKVCALAPDSVGDFSRVERLAQRCVAGTENHHLRRWFILAKGLTDYRGGRHAEAVDWLQRFAPNVDGAHCDATAFAALAMAHHRLGHADQARTSLDSAQAIIAKKPPDWTRSGYWYDWLHSEIFCREAKGLMGVVSPQEAAELSETEKKQ